MKLLGVTYKNTEIDDQDTYTKLPPILQQFLKEVNGIIAYKGGLHFRGACKAPSWHSINEVWTGKHAFWKFYPDILDIDIPFAEDCMGDQYLLRNNKVIKLYAETGEVEFLNLEFVEFLNEIEKDPVNFLGMHPLIQFEMDGGKLEPGQLLHAYPPFCMKQAIDVVIKSIPAEEQLEFLAKLSRQMRSMEDGDQVQFIVE